MEEIEKELSYRIYVAKEDIKVTLIDTERKNEPIDGNFPGSKAGASEIFHRGTLYGLQEAERILNKHRKLKNKSL